MPHEEDPCGCEDQERLERAARACVDIAREMDRTMDYRPCQAIERILNEALRAEGRGDATVAYLQSEKPSCHDCGGLMGRRYVCETCGRMTDAERS